MVKKFWDLSEYSFGEFVKDPMIPYGSVTNISDKFEFPLLPPYGSVTIIDPEFPIPYGSVTAL